MTVFGKNRHREYSFAKLLSRIIARNVRVKEERALKRATRRSKKREIII